LTKLDAVFPEVKSARTFNEIPKEAKLFVTRIEKETSVEVAFVGTGPDALDLIDRRE
jgi:adenylosuccinate synthase